MCGICGIIDTAKAPIDKARVTAMARAMAHRGPDDEGIYSAAGVCLGHRRLSIIDLSSAGHQPLSNEDKAIWAVLNGEIYNYKELRGELQKKGHTFHSNSDTEVLVHLYEAQGKECVKSILGMYAFAVWDSKRQSLLLARDRIGKKPLLYSYRDGKLCFASEFRALLESNLVEKKINLQALDYYFTFGYIPAPLTIYANVFKLLPGHILCLEKQQLKTERYWQLDFTKKLDICEKEAKEEISRLLTEAVRARLYSDVPLGVFLSGGIDSSLVVGMMAKLCNQKIRTFSIGFDEAEYDELKYARSIARHFDTDHKEFIVRPKALDVLPALVEHYGEPYADPSCIPTYYLAQMSKQYVSVVLNGDGGDELFAGYDRYQAMLYSSFFDNIPLFLRKKIHHIAMSIIPETRAQQSGMRKIKRFFNAIGLPPHKRYMQWIGVFDDELKESVYSPDFLKSAANNPSDALFKSALNDTSMHVIDRLLKLDTMTYLPDDLLVKVDIATMSHGLEARSPLLDHRLMEFVAALPVSFKLRGATKKYILKKVAKQFIPWENIYRPKKGFGVPIGEWFRGELKGILLDNVLDRHFLKIGYFNKKALQGIVTQHMSEKENHSFQLWTLLMFSLWYRKFIGS